MNDATKQVLRGASGLVNHLFKLGGAQGRHKGKKGFLPVVFTTVELWVTDADLGAADLMSGNLEEGKSSKVDWVWFNHNRSPMLRHDLDWSGLSDDLEMDLVNEFTRSIAIVGVAGLDRFLSTNLNLLFEL